MAVLYLIVFLVSKVLTREAILFLALAEFGVPLSHGLFSAIELLQVVLRCRLCVRSTLSSELVEPLPKHFINNNY